EHAGRQGFAADEVEPVRGGVLEQALPVAHGDRVDEEVEFVEEAVGEQPAHGGGAARHGDVAVDAVLEAADRVGVAGQHRGVVPGRVGQRGGDHVFGHGVEVGRERL